MIARAVELSAEQVYENNIKNNEDTHAAEVMRKEYATLYDNLSKDDFIPAKVDYARLLIGCSIVVTQLKRKVEAEQKALEGYRVDTIPKLDQIMQTKTEKEALELAQKLFSDEALND